ncbi:MAG: MBL fold metallo-hydrolase [Prevotella sp.]|nr:MBL fold metallo-hydrolase [Prevotella sp.]
MDTFKTKSGKTLAVTPIKHASMELDFDGLIIQVDPVTDGAAPVTDYTQWRKADVILITHDHYDHVDAQAVEALSKDGTVIVANGNAAALLGDGEVLYNGDNIRLADDLVVHAVAAYNITPGHTQFHPKGRDNGYIIEADGLRVYIAGDTEDIEEMAEVGPVDVAFLPCNQPYTMTPQQLRHAADMVRPDVLFPYHYGDTAPEAMMAALDGSGIEVRIREFQ